jgi:hypothetical protein
MVGMISFFADRINELYWRNGVATVRSEKESLALAGLRDPIFEYFKRFYYDTVIGGSALALQVGREVMGADRIVFGTDYPWGPDAGRIALETYPRIVRKVFNEDDQTKIFESNVTSLHWIDEVIS